jgi:hypothetical protein
MLRQSLRGLAVAAAAALGSPAPAAAVTPVNACADLTKAGETYVLTADITFPLGRAACFVVLADRITLDLNGHTMTGPGAVFDGQVGISDNNQARTSTVVKNGSVRAFEFGLLLQQSTRSTVRGVTASDNVVGMVIGPNSLVKDCTVQRNLQDGIQAGDGVQVEGCLIGGDDATGNAGNGGSGILGGQRMLVTRNTVIGNVGTGIVVDADSTVTHNTASGNEATGIGVGERSLVTHNTANNNSFNGIFTFSARNTVSFNTANANGRNGIDVVCPSTVTNNAASGNGNLNFSFVGACVEKNNTSPPLPN